MTGCVSVCTIPCAGEDKGPIGQASKNTQKGVWVRASGDNAIQFLIEKELDNAGNFQIIFYIHLQQYRQVNVLILCFYFILFFFHLSLFSSHHSPS